MMQRVAALLAAAACLPVLLAAPKLPACYEEYQCTYFKDGVSWNLHPLCSSNPLPYKAQRMNPGTSASPSPTPLKGAFYGFTLMCAAASKRRVHQSWLRESRGPPVFSHGVGVYFLEPECFTDPTNPACPPPGQTCLDSLTGAQVPCTGDCQVIAQPTLPVFQAVVGSSTSICPGCVGLNLTYTSVPSLATDSFECANDPVSNTHATHVLTRSCTFHVPFPRCCLCRTQACRVAERYSSRCCATLAKHRGSVALCVWHHSAWCMWGGGCSSCHCSHTHTHCLPPDTH